MCVRTAVLHSDKALSYLYLLLMLFTCIFLVNDSFLSFLGYHTVLKKIVHM